MLVEVFKWKRMMKSNYQGRGDGWRQANIHKGGASGDGRCLRGGGSVRERAEGRNLGSLFTQFSRTHHPLVPSSRAPQDDSIAFHMCSNNHTTFIRLRISTHKSTLRNIRRGTVRNVKY